MTIARKPHPVFAVLWLAWSVFLLYVTKFPSLTVQGILWLSFGLIEGTAMKLNTGQRDTLSELATWTHRHLVKAGPFQKVPYRGWNALLFTPYIGLIGFNIAMTFGGPLGIFVGSMTSAGLWHHWISPEVYG